MAKDLSLDDAKLEVSFTLGRNKTVLVVGTYDHTQSTTDDRLAYWSIISQFGNELGVELVENYDAELFRLIMCEVDPGHIQFEIETNVNATIRRKAIESVQQVFLDDNEEVMMSEPQSFPVNGPDGSQ